MRTISRLFFTAAIAALISSTAIAQSQTGGQTSSSGQLGGAQGSQNSQNGGTAGGSSVGLPFGAAGSVGVTAQQFETTSNNVTNSSNILGGYYANPMYQGKIGSSGAQSPGGFGQALYSSGTTGGMTGAGGNRTGSGTTGSRTGSTGGGSTFGSANSTSTGFGSTGSTGNRGGSTAGFGSTTGSSGFGSNSFGSTGMNGMSNRSGQSGMGMNGSQNQYAIPADRQLDTFFRPGNMMPGSVPPMVTKAQTELRAMYERTASIPSGKLIEVAVNDSGIVRLRGTVATDDERRLAVGLAKTTPGVRQVVSEITVQNKP